MKKEYIMAICIIVIILGGVVYLFTRKKEKDVEIDDILHLYITYSKGYMANSNIIYSFDYDEK